MVSWSWTPTAMLICSTRSSNESWTSLRRYGQVVVAVASTTAAIYRTRRAKPSSSVGDLNVGTVEPGYSLQEAYLSACSTAHERILKSQGDHIKSELDEAAGDVRATWRTAQRLLHSIRYDTRCYFNVRSEADMSRLNLPHGNDN